MHGPKTSWEGISDWYASYLAQPGTMQNEVVFPGALRLLEPKDGGRYLDIACGEGAFVRLLAKRVRAEIVGIDASLSLIQRARKTQNPNLKFHVADAAHFAKIFPAASFDGASCILAIQNIETLTPVFEEAANVLKPNAPFVIVMNHPSFRQPRQSGWGWDEMRKLQYRRVDRYLSAYEMPIVAHPGSASSEKTYSYHRPLSAYVQELAKQGFVIDALEEWISPKKSDSGPKARAENMARAEIPLFLALRARRMRS